MPFAFLFASHGGTETTEMAVALGLRFWLCERSPSSTLRVSLPGAARPAVVSPHQASLVVDTTLDLDDGLSMDSKGAFSVWVIFGEKRLVLMCCRIAKTGLSPTGTANPRQRQNLCPRPQPISVVSVPPCETMLFEKT